MSPEKLNPEALNSESSRKTKSVESEPSAESKDLYSYNTIKDDLQINYSDHLKSIENASFGILDSVVKSARLGFQVSLVLNILIFSLGVGVIIIGLIMLLNSPESFGRIVGIVSSVAGFLLVITLLFWKGPLDRILESVSNLARINAITIGLAHRLNQISRVFVQESLKGKMSLKSLDALNGMIEGAVGNSVEKLNEVMPKESAEKQAQAVTETLLQGTTKS
ncbi:MAG: hypothetical protein AB1607_09630 [Chloroflexota bacterium]